jgi:hypothetical protein
MGVLNMRFLLEMAELSRRQTKQMILSTNCFVELVVHLVLVLKFFSYTKGSLGVILSAKMHLIPAKPFVKLEYVTFTSMEDALKGTAECSTIDNTQSWCR